MWALTIVVLPFSFAIAILKDVPDAEGDRRFRIRTFTVRVGGAKVFRAGVAVLALAYVGDGGARAAADPGGRPGRARRRAPRRAGAAAAVGARRDPGDPAVFTRFYMRVWKLFFLEYALVALACLAG